MLEGVIINDYQAVGRARIRLGKFTVVTGPTGSGKSAVIRAMKLAAFNARGTGYIRHGKKECVVWLASRTDNFVIAIRRGARGRDVYKLARYDDKAATDFTKLAGKVPAEVTAAHRLTELNFAGQFDRPYLLDATGSAVAQVLGELTNVTLVFDAAREANRRKLELGRELKVWEITLQSLKDKAAGFAGLKERRAAARQAADRWLAADRFAGRLYRLEQQAATVENMSRARREARARLAGLAVPDGDELDRLYRLRNRLACFRDTLTEADQFARSWKKAAAVAVREEEDLHQQLHQVLVDAGVCPTCGQQVPEG